MASAAGNNASLAFLSTLIPGVLLVFVYIYILKNSSRPFPLMLEDHLGRPAGKVLGCFYFFSFLLLAVLTTRSFVSFSESMFMTGFPISILIAAILLPGFYVLRSGLRVFAGVSELINLIYFPLALILLLLGLRKADWQHLMPIGYISFKSLAFAAFQPVWHLANLFVILTLAYFCNDRSKIPSTLFKTFVVIVLLSSLAIAVAVMNLGAELTSLMAYPIFSVTRSVSLDFIKNIEVLFISLFLAGIFVSISLNWFMACYTCQQVFNLNDYRFLLGPTGIIISFLTVQIAPNFKILYLIWKNFAPYFFAFFTIVIPLVIAVVILFKPRINPELDTGIKAPREEIK